jgi:hypothetical protein
LQVFMDGPDWPGHDEGWQDFRLHNA